MAKREEQKARLESALKDAISRINQVNIKGVPNNFKINSVTIFSIEILFPTEDIDADDFENAEKIEFIAEIGFQIMDNQILKRESKYNCVGNATTKYINGDFMVEVEIDRIDSK